MILDWEDYSIDAKRFVQEMHAVYLTASTEFK